MADPQVVGLPRARGGYRYELLRRADIETLRRFRNAQIDVLRQVGPISPEQQERWFDQVVVPDHSAPQPPQILISILDGDGAFLGYGGLTNIAWESRRAEVSFLVDPERATDEEVYRRDMTEFLSALADLAFGDLGLNRLFTETYAFREFHIGVLESVGFVLEGRLREHVMANDGFRDSVVHGLLAADWSSS